jgi:hypothetical protein
MDELIHLLELGWPSIAHSPSRTEEGMISLSVPVACGGNTVMGEME